MKVQQRSLEELTFTSVTGVAGSIYSMMLLILVLGVQFWVALFPTGSSTPQVKNFFQNYLGVFVMAVYYIAHKLMKRNWSFYIPLKDIDLDTGRTIIDIELLEKEKEEEKLAFKEKPWYGKMYSFWC